MSPLPEYRRGGDASGDVEVAPRPAPVSRLALAGQPDPAAVVDPGGDVDAIALGLLGDAAARGGRTRIIDHAALAAALGAGLGDREDPLALGIDPAPLAAGADARSRSRLRSGSRAGRAGAGGGNGDRHLGPVHRLVEREPDLRLQVAAAGGPRTLLAAAAEEGGED